MKKHLLLAIIVTAAVFFGMYSMANADNSARIAELTEQQVNISKANEQIDRKKIVNRERLILLEGAIRELTSQDEQAAAAEDTEEVSGEI